MTQPTYRMSRRGFGKNIRYPEHRYPRGARPASQTHNKCPPRASWCDGCERPILAHEPVHYGKKLPVMEEIQRVDGTMVEHPRVAAYHSILCEQRRIYRLTEFARLRSSSKPSP